MKSRDGIAKSYLTPAGTYKVRFYCEENKEQNKKALFGKIVAKFEPLPYPAF